MRRGGGAERLEGEREEGEQGRPGKAAVVPGPSEAAGEGAALSERADDREGRAAEGAGDHVAELLRPNWR